MKLDIVWTAQFKKDYKLAVKRGLKIDLIDDIIRQLSKCQPLPRKNRDHLLSGNYVGYRDVIFKVTGCLCIELIMMF